LRKTYKNFLIKCFQFFTLISFFLISIPARGEAALSICLNILNIDIDLFIIYIFYIGIISITSIILISKNQKIIKTIGQIGGAIAVGIGTTESVLNLTDRYKEYKKKQSSNDGGPSSDDNKDKDKDKRLRRGNKKESTDKNDSKKK
jgi:hypothetical protein